MKDSLVVNFHEHPSAQVAKRNADLGIDRSVLLPVGTGARETARGMAQDEPQSYYAFDWVDASADLAAEARRIRDAAQRGEIRGVKFQPMDQHWFADDRRIYPLYEVCAEQGLVCTWHAGIVNLGFKYELGVPMLARFTAPLPIDQVAFDFPELMLCIAHMGGNFHYRALVLAEKHENVYMDTAFLPFFCARMLPEVTPGQLIERAARIAGAQKVLYGCEGLRPEAVLETTLSEEEKRLILGGNALRLLGE